ncbi:MAG: lipid A deacylase LpxR family protein [Gammaproteobacteria bacterium]|nr:lipid A deacylase LpxR family protein [Gammaproteobacteria bacterium]
MKTKTHYFTFYLILLILVCNSANSSEAIQDKQHWFSLTLDNDIFIGSDSGYTNGLYLSFYESSNTNKLEMPVLTRWMKSSLKEANPRLSYNATTFGQVIVTPSNIEDPTPNPNDIPYAGLAFLHQVGIQDYGVVADKASVTLGIVGPSSGAESTQKYIHEITGSQQPKGWDYQVKDEIVFQVARGRAWKIWASENEHFDIVSGGDIKLGTLESSINVGSVIRYGRYMADTYSSVLLNDDRTTNPININNGWYFYAGVSANYIGNLIYLDGNTFRESPSIGYDRLQFNGQFGLTYAFDGFSISLARNNIDLKKDNKSLARLKEYGSMTFLWRLD